MVAFFFYCGLISKECPKGVRAKTENFTPRDESVPRLPVTASTNPPVISNPNFVVGSGSAIAAATIQTPALVIPRAERKAAICFHFISPLLFAALINVTAERKSLALRPRRASSSKTKGAFVEYCFKVFSSQSGSLLLIITLISSLIAGAKVGKK